MSHPGPFVDVATELHRHMDDVLAFFARHEAQPNGVTHDDYIDFLDHLEAMRGLRRALVVQPCDRQAVADRDRVVAALDKTLHDVDEWTDTRYTL